MQVGLVGEVILERMIKALCNTRLVSVAVLPNTELAIDKRQSCSSTNARKDCCPTACKGWCFLVCEKKGRDDVTKTVP